LPVAGIVTFVFTTILTIAGVAFILVNPKEVIKMWQAWINAILGLWFIVAAFIFAGGKTFNITNGLITGIILLILGIWAAVSYKGWKNWVIAIIGVWMVVSGFWFPASYVATVANDIVAGAAIIILSLWAWAGSSKVPQPKDA